MNDAEVNLGVDINEKSAQSSINNLQKSSSTLGKGFSKAGLMLGKAVVSGVAIASTAIAGLITAGVKYNAEIEQLQTSFEVMTGSADKAVEVVNKLKKVGAETPYELAGLAKTTQTLMQYGLTADEAYQATLNFGDISQGSAEKMQSIALAYGQMSSAGKVNMQDIKQMINAGFNPLQAIAEMTGETMEQVTARYEDNKISVEEVTKAMQFASSEGGKYYQSMEKQSKTLNGQISTLKDNFSQFAGIIANDTTSAISGSFLPALNTMLEEATKIFEEGGISALIENLPALLTPFLDNIITMLSEFITKGAEVFIQLLPALLDIIIKILPQLVTALIQIMPMFIQALIDSMPMLLQTILGLLPTLLEAVIDLTIMIIEGLAEMLPDMLPDIIEAIIKLVPLLIEKLPLFVNAGLKLIIGLLSGIIQALPRIWAELPNIIAKIIGYFAQLPGQMINYGKNLVSGLWSGISNSFSWIKDKIKGWVGDVMKFIKKLFGIASPSKEFAIIGRYNVEGMMVGIDDMESKLDKQLEKTFGIDYNPNYGISPKLNAMSNTYITINNDMELDSLGQLVNNVKTFSNGSKLDYIGV